MPAPPHRQTRAMAQAATWFARLSATAVSVEDLQQFQAWRRRPRNDGAYSSVERIWRESGALQNDPDIQAALKSTKDGHDGRRRGAGAAVWWRAGAIAALATGGFFALIAIDFDGLRYGQIHKTAIGEERIVSLADGSRVRLDTNTRLAVRMTANSRRITLLGGQAYFEVAHDRTRPFVVDAAATEILAVGTQFDVRKDAGAVHVTLIEGVVKVHSPGPKEPALTLRQGQALAVINGGRPITLRLTDLRSSTGWTTGRLYFAERPLSEAVAEVNRYSRKRVDLDAPGLGEILVSGTFETGDPEAFISAVCKLYGLKADPQTDGSVVLRAQSPSAARQRPKESALGDIASITLAATAFYAVTSEVATPRHSLEAQPAAIFREPLPRLTANDTRTMSRRQQQLNFQPNPRSSVRIGGLENDPCVF